LSPRPMGALLPMALALAFTLSACEDDPETPPVAWLVAHTGTVRIDRADSAEGGSKDAPLYHGNLVSTGAAATATVRYSDRTQLTVGENTRFRIGAENGRLTLELEAGTILSSARQGGAGGLTIVTRYGRMQLLQGAEIQFSLGTDGTSSMQVLFGSIEVLTSDGGTVTVLQGEAMDFNLGTRTVLAGPEDAGTAVAAEPDALPLQLVFAASRGKATLKPEGSARFVPAAPEETPVAPGTDFRVLKGASALLRGKGLSSRLGANSAGVIGTAEQQGETERYALNLQSGATELEFTNRSTRTVDLISRGREARLESSDLGSVGVVVGKRGMEFLVRAGEVKLTAGGETRALSSGDSVELVGNVLRPTRKVTAALALPLSRKLRVHALRLETVSLALPAHEGPVKVEVARDPEFTDRIFSGMVTGRAVIAPAPASGELHWRALVADEGGQEEELGRGLARFFPDRGQTDIDLDNPHAEVAETGLKATVLFQTVAPAVTFAFAPKPDAHSYRVRVFRAGELKKPVAEKVVTEPRSSFAAGQIPEGEYLWNATPLSAAGSELSGGRMNRLELVYDNSRTSLAIARPRMNEVVSASSRALTVEGIAPVGSKLFVNGKAAPVGDKGRFTMEVPTDDTLVFRLVTAGGAEGYWVRQLRRRR